MTTIAIFPQKPDKDCQYLKDQKKVLEIDDSEVLKLLQGNKGVYHYSRHDSSLDGLTDQELVLQLKQVEGFGFFDSPISNKHSGKGYSTTDKKYYVRIIRQESKTFE